MRRQVLGKTGRHMSSQREEQVFQVCTLSTLYPIQAGLGMLEQGKGSNKEWGRASARLSTGQHSRSERWGREFLTVRFKDQEENYSEKAKHVGLKLLGAVMRDPLPPQWQHSTPDWCLYGMPSSNQCLEGWNWHPMRPLCMNVHLPDGAWARRKLMGFKWGG